MEHTLANAVGKLSAPLPRNRTVKLVTLLLCWQERWAQRRSLEGMDDQILRDIGLSRADIHQEVRKPFWQG